jgi:hydrogenase-4 component E
MNINFLAWVSLALVLSNLYLLSTSRITGLSRGVAVQGFLLGTLPVLIPSPAETLHVILLVVLSITVKGLLIPRYLFLAIRDVRELREINPLVGYSLSMLYGTVVSSAAFFALRIVPASHPVISPFHAATAIATALIGLFLIVTSRNVVRQIIGYIVFENSTFIFGISLAAFQPLFVEMGVLLDMLVAVFIMMVAVNCIHNEHATISVAPLERLTR